MVVNIIETLQHILDALNASTLDIVDEALLFAGRQQQAREVIPVAFANGGCGFAKPSAFDSTLQHSAHIDA